MANLRILASEEMVGHGHGTKADTLNRAFNVEHLEDGKHSILSNDITQADGKYYATDKIRARDGDGLLLEDDGGNGIEIVDGGTIHMAMQSGFSAYLGSEQDVGSGAAEIVDFDREEDDPQSEFNLGTFTFTVDKDGVYQVSTVLKYKETIADTKYFEIMIKKNAAYYTRVLHSAGDAANLGGSISVRMLLVATDTIQIWTLQNEGANRKLDETYCRFSIAKVA